MRTILVLNPKGGCGKSTLATNLASYYATLGNRVCLADYDGQNSSLDWLAARPEERPAITAANMTEEGARLPRGHEVAIMDAPAATHGADLKKLVRSAQTLIMPVLPSPMDMRASARFIHELLADARVSRQKTRIGVVANRVRTNTLVYLSLSRFLRRLKIPVIATLRDTQNYIRAAENGLGIFEMPPSQVDKDLEQWEKLTRWLRSKRSLPSD